MEKEKTLGEIEAKILRAKARRKKRGRVFGQDLQDEQDKREKFEG
jgi:hypothetical protein